MSNMKREWEEEQEKNYREAGLTQETLDRIQRWLEQKSEGCGCDNCSCGDSDD